MTVIKEFATCSKIAIIREDNYASGLDKFIRLFEEAKKDFPLLEIKNVRVIHYGGMRYSGTFGLEFKIDPSLVPDSWIKQDKVELTS